MLVVECFPVPQRPYHRKRILSLLPMATDPKSKPSFSVASRWRIGFDVVLRTVLVLAVVVMANYLGAKFFHRFYLSSQTQVQLSPRTLAVLRSLTNRVDVTLYYDRKADFY